MDCMARALMAAGGRASPVRALIDATDALADPARLRQLAIAQGYLYVRDLAPLTKVRQLRAHVLAQCARRGWLDDDASRSRAVAHVDAARSATREALLELQGDVQIVPVFAELRGDAAIVSVLEAVFDAPAGGGHGDVCRLAFPADLERTTRPHQDHFYTRGTRPLWTAWIPLDDCPPALGGLKVLPGSHSRGLLSHDGGQGEERFIELDDDAAWAGTSFRAGDVLFVNALTVHGARPNLTSNRIRLSVDYRYRPLASSA
jgi:ectoine hydroxylase-related dioxygenase (phytanoyl-CoA dioxygenase family)